MTTKGTKRKSSAPVEVDELPRRTKETGASGSFNICTRRISPDGHRPSSFCHETVYFASRVPIGWRTSKAVTDEFPLIEHSCRDWTPEEDARQRRLKEEVNLSRFRSIYQARTETSVAWATDWDKAAPSTELKKRRPRLAANSLDAYKVIPKEKPAGKSKGPRLSNGIVLQKGKTIEALVRKAKKVHTCNACRISEKIQISELYIDSIEDGHNPANPMRICLECATKQGYQIVRE